MSKEIALLCSGTINTTGPV